MHFDTCINVLCLNLKLIVVGYVSHPHCILAYFTQLLNNSYGIRWNIQMPLIIAKSISILSDAGLGMAMFSLGMTFILAKIHKSPCNWPNAYGKIWN